jgi:hypothetical protein
MIKRGRNYFSLNETDRRMFSSGTNKRVFISHKKEDKDLAKKVADYIMEAGVDVYFDEYDTTINRNDPLSVVSAIKKGMQLSTHMLVVFTNNTLLSTWVPWEIGYGDATKTEIRILKMNDIKKDRLPEYMQIVKVLLDIYDLNQFLAKIQDTTTDNLINEGAIRQYNSQYNKLKDSVEPYVANI